MTWRRRTPQITLALSLAAVAIATPAAAQSVDQLYAKARGEGALQFYSGGPIAPYERFINDFKQQFPGLTVSITGGFSNVLNAKINDQLHAKKLAVDMAFFQTCKILSPGSAKTCCRISSPTVTRRSRRPFAIPMAPTRP